MIALIIPDGYFSEETLSRLKPQQGLSERYQRRALDVTLACKLTHVYGKYHLAMLHRELAMSESIPPRQQFILSDQVVEVEGLLLAQTYY